MLDYGQFLSNKSKREPPFNPPLLCGRVRAEILRKRSLDPKIQNHLIYQPSSLNAIN